MRTDRDGRGYINMLAADKLMQNPRLYATFLLWLLSELFEELPEVGDPAQAEARVLLRRGASAVHRCAEGAARQDRAGGAADPLQGRRRLFRDAEPARRAGQGARHSSATACSTRLRAFTPRDQKAVKAAADTFRPNPKLDTAQVITQLGKGEALGLVPRRERHAVDGRARHDPSAVGAHRAGHAGGAQGRDGRRARRTASTIRPSIRIRPTKSCRSASQGRRGAALEQAPAPAQGSGRRRRHSRTGLGSFIGGIFGTNNPRGARLSPGQVDRPERRAQHRLARSARDLTKSLGGGATGRVAGQIIRGTLGGVLRR